MWGEGAEVQYNFIYFQAGFTALITCILWTSCTTYFLALWDVHVVWCIFFTTLTFNLWCMQNLQTPVFMVEESLFSAERGIKPFFGWNETHCTLGNGSAEMLAFPHSTCIVSVRFSSVSNQVSNYRWQLTPEREHDHGSGIPCFSSYSQYSSCTTDVKCTWVS